jgi:streptogramin lyase
MKLISTRNTSAVSGVPAPSASAGIPLMPRPVPTHSADLRRRTAFCPRSARVLFLVLALALSSIATFGNRPPSLTAHFSGSLSPVVTGPLFGANGFAMDGSGNIFVSVGGSGSPGSSLVLEATLSGGTYNWNLVAGGFSNAWGIAVDGSGNLYIADRDAGIVYKETLSAGGYTQSVVVSGLGWPTGVAVDASGNLFVADQTGGVVQEETPGVGGYTQTTLPLDLSAPTGVAVDSSGNVYIADPSSSYVWKATPTSGGYTGSEIAFMPYPRAVAVDGSGNVYVASSAGFLVKAIPSGSTYLPNILTEGPALGNPNGVTLDGSGNIIILSPMLNEVLELTAAGGNFGAVNVRDTSLSPVQLIFSVDTAGVLGSTAVLTQGTPGLDFSNAGNGTCTAATYYDVGYTCTVNVTFSPTFAGTRYGGAELLDFSGTLIANGYVQGTGVGPQVTFSPGTLSSIGSGFLHPWGVAVDASGNLFVADSNNNAVKEIVAAGGYTTVKTLGSGFSFVAGVAVDGSGNVFVSDSGNHAVREIVAAGGYTTIITLAGNFGEPAGLAVDGSGNVFVADYRNGGVFEILAAGGYTTVKTVGSGFSNQVGVAVDGSGNVFVSDNYYHALEEITPAAGYATVKTLSSAFTDTFGVAVDGSGNVYVVDAGDNAVNEILAAGGYTIVNTLGSGFGYPLGVAVDGSGNVFIADQISTSIGELDFADAPSLAFPTATAVGSIDTTDVPQSVTVTNFGNAPLFAVGAGLMLPADFTQAAGSGYPVDCTSSFYLNAGETCNLSIGFTPHATGWMIRAAAMLHCITSMNC